LREIPGVAGQHLIGCKKGEERVLFDGKEKSKGTLKTGSMVKKKSKKKKGEWRERVNAMGCRNPKHQGLVWGSPVGKNRRRECQGPPVAPLKGPGNWFFRMNNFCRKHKKLGRKHINRGEVSSPRSAGQRGTEASPGERGLFGWLAAQLCGESGVG